MNRIAQAGRNAEEEARWHLARCFGESKNWRVLHDLTLPDHRSTSPCQIDHVLVGRLADVIVLETKSAVEGMKLDVKTGAWSVYYNGRPKPVPSPIEQNKRHIEVLAHHLEKHAVFPKRLGIPVKPTFHSWILVQPGVSLPLEYEGAWIVQRDQIEKRFAQFTNRMGLKDLLTVMGRGELEDIAQFLESFLTQVAGVATPTVEPPKPAISSTPAVRRRGSFCEACDVEIEPRVASFCRINARRFAGKYLCRKCQSFAP